MRCQSCPQITFASIRGCEVQQQESFPALKSSAESGCDLCGLVYTALTSSFLGVTTRYEDKEVKTFDMLCNGLHPTRPDIPDTRVFIEAAADDYYECNQHKDKITRTVSLRVGGFSEGNTSVSTMLNIGTDPNSILTKYICGRVPSQYPGDAVAMSRIKGWIEECDKLHKSCAFLSVERPQPKRILNISKNKPVVIQTNSTEGRYVALSYCWGTSGKNILLTHETFDDFTTEGIDLDTLPKTIQDAIFVCKAVGIHRLWVDALCIIQREPDLKDFIAEAPRMAEYYSNAFLTLVAGSSRDCAEGFLNNRESSKSPPCELAYDRTTFPSDTHMTGNVSLFLSPSQDPGPIRDRAWTFQESKLSQRTLIYGPDQMQFVCPTKSVYEAGDFKIIHGSNKPMSSYLRDFPGIHDLLRHDKEPESINRAYELWFANLYGYTSREMSNHLDKLAAMAGYAKLVQSVVQCRYVYGLWEGAMPQSLLWQTLRPWIVKGKTSPVKRVEHRAPSWSWASIDGPITRNFNPNVFREQSKDPEYWKLTILSYDNVSCSLDPIREVVNIPESFELKVRGYLRDVWYMPKSSGAASDFVLSVDEPNVQLLQDPTKERVATGTWDTYDDFKDGTFCKQPLHALLLARDRGWLLVQVDGKRYRRVGRFLEPKDDLFKDISPDDITLI